MFTLPAAITERLIGWVFDFLKKSGENLAKDMATKKQVSEAIESAAERFASGYEDKKLAEALAVDTRFYDLESVQNAIYEILEHPFDPAPQVKIEKEFEMVLPENQRRLASKAAQAFLEILHEQLMGIEKLQAILSLIYQKRTAVGIEKLVAKQEISASEIDRAKEQYLQYIIDINQLVGSSGRRLARMKLDELYVKLTKKDAGDISIADAVHNNARVVILGNPGTGKTTLMRFLALHFANALKNGQDDVVDKEKNNYGSVLLPIYLRVSYFADALSRNRSLALKDYLLESCDGGEADKTALRQLLSIALKEGKALVLLDGLDEVIDSGDRAEIVKRIEQFVFACNQQTRFILTSRVAGYDYSLRDDIFVEFQLNDLGRSEIEKYLKRIQKEFGVEAEKLLRAIDENPGAGKLVTNQLMLAIMVDVFERDKVLPVRRVELYDKAINILVNEWQKKERGLSERVLESYEILNLLAPLAYWIHENKTNGLAIEKEVENKLAEFWSKANDVKPSHFEVQKKVKEFFGRAIDTGILVKFAEGKFGFSHLTFQEYLAGCDIARRESETEKLIYEHRHSARWEEIILLAVAYVSSNDPDKAEKLIRTSIVAEGLGSKDFSPSEYEEILHRDSLLAIRCISECVGLSSEFCNRTLNQLLHIFFDVEGSGKYAPLARRILHVLESLGNSEVAESVEQLLLEELRQKENDKSRCIYALISLGRRTKEVEDALLNCLNDESEYVRCQAAGALGKLKLDSQESIRALLAVLQDKDIDVQAKAVEALGELNNTDEIVLNALLRLMEVRDGEEVERIIVKKATLISLSKLGEGNSKLRDLLFILLSGILGAIAGETLGKFGRKDDLVIKGLIKALQDKNWEVRENAALAFKFLTDKFPTDEIINLLDSELGYVRHSAILTIGKSGVLSERVVDALLSRLNDTESEVRKIAFKMLEQSQVTPELVIKYLEKEVELRSSYSFMGLNGVFEKWAGKDNDIVEKGLLIGLHHKSDLVRLNSVQVLSALEKHSAQVFIELLNVLKNDENKDVQLVVVEALGRIGHHNDELIVGLVEKLHGDDWRAHQAAIWALEGFGVKDTRIADGLLFVLLNDQDQFTRGYAADALADLGIDTYNVIEGLRHVIKESRSLHVIVRAAKALRKLGQELDKDDHKLAELYPDKDEEEKGFLDFPNFIVERQKRETWLTRKEITETSADRIKRERNYDLKWVYMDELATRGIKHPTADIEIINGMKSQDRDLRSMSAQAAGNLQVETPDSINCLISLLQDEDDYIRRCAVEALGKMDGKFREIWDGLIQSLEDTSPSVRLHAIRGLGRLSDERARKLNPEFIKKIKQSLVNALTEPQNTEVSILDGLEHFQPLYNYAWMSLSQVTFVP